MSKFRIYINFSIELLITIVCSIGLFYQSLEVLNQYMLGKTVVNIQVSTEDDGQLPAITICYEAMLSYNKLIAAYPSLARDVSKSIFHTDTLRKHDQSLYFLLQHLNGSIDFQEMFDNYSLNYRFGSDNRAIVIIIEGQTMVEPANKIFGKFRLVHFLLIRF